MQILTCLRAAAIGVVLVLTGVLGLTLAGQQRGSSQPTVKGVWRDAENRSTGPNGRTNPNPQPGLLIFTDRHFAVMRVSSDTPRPELPPQPTDKQIADAFRGFDAPRGGTYEVTGDELTYRLIVAMNPNAMRPGSFSTFTYRLEGANTLWLTTKAGNDGPVANPITIKFTRLE